MPAALDVPWDVIRMEFAQGVSIGQLCSRYNLKEGTLCSRAKREKWMELRPQTHAISAMEAQRAAAQKVGTSLAEQGQAYAARMFAKASKLAEEAKIKKVTSVKDLEIVDKIARRSAGLDTAEMAVNTVIGIGGMDFAPPMQQGEIVEMPSSQNALPEGEGSDS